MAARSPASIRRWLEIEMETRECENIIMSARDVRRRLWQRGKPLLDAVLIAGTVVRLANSGWVEG
jgi:hypothetical protein